MARTEPPPARPPGRPAPKAPPAPTVQAADAAARTDVINASAGAIENSRWKSRVVMLTCALVALLGTLSVAVFLNKGLGSVHALERLIVVVLVLAVVTPSAEQLSKMLAQVFAIRFGVGTPPKDTP